MHVYAGQSLPSNILSTAPLSFLVLILQLHFPLKPPKDSFGRHCSGSSCWFLTMTTTSVLTTQLLLRLWVGRSNTKLFSFKNEFLRTYLASDQPAHRHDGQDLRRELKPCSRTLVGITLIFLPFLHGDCVVYAPFERWCTGLYGLVLSLHLHS